MGRKLNADECRHRLPGWGPSPSHLEGGRKCGSHRGEKGGLYYTYFLQEGSLQLALGASPWPEKQKYIRKGSIVLPGLHALSKKRGRGRFQNLKGL